MFVHFKKKKKNQCSYDLFLSCYREMSMYCGISLHEQMLADIQLLTTFTAHCLSSKLLVTPKTIWLSMSITDLMYQNLQS